MEITACPVCGSKNIGIGTLGDGIISGLSSWNEVCRNCGYQGTSLIFESEAEYNKFLEGLAYQKKQAEASKEKPFDGTSARPLAETTSTHVAKKSYLFELVLSSILTIVFFMVLSMSQYVGVYTNLFPQNNLGVFVVFVLSSFVGVLLFFFLCFILIETLIRSIRAREK